MREDHYIILEHPVRAAGMQIRRPERIYVCGHGADSEAMHELAERIQGSYEADAWISRGREAELPEGELEMILSGMTLVVFPVTGALLAEPERIADRILPAAKAEKIPLLPVLMEPGLGSAFTDRFGPMHLMDFGRPDFDEQLASFLKRRADLFYDISERPMNPEDSFGFRIFLSYRKKDAVWLHRLVKRIRSWEEQLNTSLWFDDELIPGENYHIQISDQLHHADLVILVVTEHLLEEGNYVMVNEYPDAVKAGKIVLPVMMSDTDPIGLHEKYPGLEGVIPFSETEILREILKGLHDRITPAVGDLDADTLYHLARGYGAGIGTERNGDLAFEAMELSAQKGNLWALVSSGKTILSVSTDEKLREEAVNRLEDALRGLYQRTTDPQTHEKEAMSILSTTAGVTELLLPEYLKREDFQRAYRSLCMAFSINDYCKRAGIQSVRMNEGVLFAGFGTILSGDGDTEEADRFFLRAEQTLNAMRASVGNPLSYLKLTEFYVQWTCNSLLQIRYGQIADRKLLFLMRDRLEKAMDLMTDLLPVVSREAAADLPFRIAGNYHQLILYFSALASDQPGWKDMPDRELAFLAHCGLLEEAEGLFSDTDTGFPVDLRYEGSVKKLKEILDQRVLWFEILGEPGEIAKEFTFDGFLPEGVFGEVTDNATASSYRCRACGKRLYRIVFPEGSDPVIPLGTEHRFCFSPARVFLCPCGRSYAAPKGKKLSDGIIFSAAPVLDRDSELGRAVFDLWWTYCNTIGDLYARRNL